MIKPWLFQFFSASPDDTAGQFSTYWDMWTRVEGLGFEGIFFSEHHFGPSFSPSPHLLIAALAPVTKTLRLGVMGTILPFYQPWRVLEELGMLDQLTKGRLEVGTASGIPSELLQGGLTPAEAAERNNEIQDILDAALREPGKPITYKGKYWTIDNLPVVPLTLQQPPPRWTTVVSEGSARRAARRGTKICTGFSSIATVKAIFDGYIEEAAQVGFPVGGEQLGLRRMITVCPTEDEARDTAAATQALVQAALAKAEGWNPVPDAPQKSQPRMTLSDDEYITGSPSQVAEQIIEQCRATGAGHVMAGLEGHGRAENNARALDLFGKEVIPILRAAGGAQSEPVQNVAVNG